MLSDLKLDIVLLDVSSAVKLGDFGLAQYMPGCDVVPGGMGTVPYMTPEALSGG